MSQTLAFTVFCLESYKAQKGISGKEADALFRKYGVYNYILEFYDVLHTTGRQYIVHDIDEFIAKRSEG